MLSSVTIIVPFALSSGDYIDAVSAWQSESTFADAALGRFMEPDQRSGHDRGDPQR